MVRLRAAAAVLVLVSTAIGWPTAVAADPIVPGRIVVSNDDWWAATNDEGSRTFAQNIASYFGNGNFLLHVENSLPYYTSGWFADAVTGHGATLTNFANVPAFTWDLDTLLEYDAVFITQRYASPGDVGASVLAEYVKTGGHVFVGLGMALNSDSGTVEAGAWNPFLNVFGMSAALSYNDIEGHIPIVSSHPLMTGVGRLYQNGGTSIALTGTNPHAHVVAAHHGQGLYAVYDAPASVPAPSTFSLMVIGSLAAGVYSRRRRKY